MQDHPNLGGPSGAPCPGSVEHRVQRWVLLELITASLSEGDGIDRLVFGLKELRPDVEAAVQALVEVGLAERDDDMVRASAAAMRFDRLWPVRA
jgi:hypothetical protein